MTGYRSLLLLLCLLLAAAPAAAEDPWATLQALRESLARGGAAVADFEQTYRSPGFESLDRETGRLALKLPDCLRWDYRDPEPKSMLICGDQVYAWSPDDGAGRRYEVDPEAEAGLDLLLLPAEELRQRYEASSRDLGEGRTELTLTPSGEAQIKVGRLVVDRPAGRLLVLEYEDLGGGTTRFEISAYRPLSAVSHEDGTDGDSLFTPPAGIEWASE